MSFLQPSLVSSVSVGTQTYNFHSAAGSEFYYKDPTKSTTYNIKYDWSVRTWLDGGSNHPLYVTHVAESEFVYTGIGDFTNPYYEPPPNTNSVSDAFVSYLVEDNELRVYIPLDKPSTFFHPNPDPPNRDLYYQLRNVSVSVGQTISLIVHTQGTPTNETIVPITAGIYQLEKVQTNPTEYTIYDTAEVTQAELDFYATNNPPDDDPPENDPPPTPVFIRGSGRRGSLNFW